MRRFGPARGVFLFGETMTQQCESKSKLSGGRRRVCARCLTSLSQDAGFRGNSTVCKKCEEVQAFDERQQKQLARHSEKRVSLIEQFTQGINVNRIKLPQTSELAIEMIEQFGGIQSFCAEFKTVIDQAKPGSKTKIDGLYAVIKLIGAANEKHSGQIDLGDLTDEEFEKHVLGLAVTLFAENPEMCREFFAQNPALLQSALEQTGLKIHGESEESADVA